MAAESAQLISTNTIKWSGGRNFDGWVLLLMAMPKVDGVAWTRISLKDKRPKLRVPTRVRVPIRDGVYDATTEIWQTTSLVPPQVKYAAFFYDDNNVLIATKSALFVVETDPYTRGRHGDGNGRRHTDPRGCFRNEERRQHRVYHFR